MISLMFALLASSAANGQAVQATLQSCALENNRYVCRYAVPDIVIVPVPGSNITAEAPASIVGSAPSAEGAASAPSTTTAVRATIIPNGSSTSSGVPAWAAGMAEGHTPAAHSTTMTPAVPTNPAPTTATSTTVEPGPIRPIDSGVLTERETQLVARCADAGWMSLCLPDDRRAARTLREKQDAYLAVRREVTRLLGDSRCDAAVRSALDGGYLALARETREYCTPPVTATPARTPTVRPAVPRVIPAPTTQPAQPARSSVLPELESKAAEPN